MPNERIERKDHLPGQGSPPKNAGTRSHHPQGARHSEAQQFSVLVLPKANSLEQNKKPSSDQSSNNSKPHRYPPSENDFQKPKFPTSNNTVPHESPVITISVNIFTNKPPVEDTTSEHEKHQPLPKQAAMKTPERDPPPQRQAQAPDNQERHPPLQKRQNVESVGQINKNPTSLEHNYQPSPNNSKQHKSALPVSPTVSLNNPMSQQPPNVRVSVTNCGPPVEDTPPESKMQQPPQKQPQAAESVEKNIPPLRRQVVDKTPTTEKGCPCCIL